MDFRRIDRIAAIVTFPIRDVGDEIFRFPERLANEFHNVDIFHLVMPADIVDLAHAAALQNQIDRLAMILHVEPIAHIFPVAVHGKCLIRQGIGDHQRN